MKKHSSAIAFLMAFVMAFTLALPVGAFADELSLGDVNADGKVNASDALLALQSAAQLTELDESQSDCADVNHDDAVSARDALMILQYVAGIIPEFPAASDQPTETIEPTEVVTEVPTEQPSEVPSEQPSEVPSEQPSEVPSEQPSEEPTEQPSEEPTEQPSEEPTEQPSEVPSEQPSEEPSERPSETPTPQPSEDLGYLPITVKETNDVAAVDGNTITFLNPAGHDNGVVLNNPFIGQDTANGAAISFWLTPAKDVEGIVYDYTSLLLAVREDQNQVIKYDLEGTRQLATVNGAKLNYWGAETSLKKGTEYFITFVINSNGLDYYVNGKSIGSTGYNGISESAGRTESMTLLSKEGTVLYAGGTTNVEASYQDLLKHELAEGTVMRDLKGYIGEVSVEDLYTEAMGNGGDTTQTPEPSKQPTPSVEPSQEPTPTPSQQPTTAPEDLIAFSGTVYIAGDSIADGVPESKPTSYVAQEGWGDFLNANYDAEKVYVDNQAKRGESCLSFFYDYDGDGDSDSKVYKAIYDNIKKDDYVIISFGHNDQNTAANRYASPTAPTSQKGSFKWWLKEKFIEPARAVGAVPILMTPVVRCTYDSSGKFTETATHLSYGQAMRDLVAEYAAEGITIYLIDAQQYTYDLYSSMTFDEAKTYHAYWTSSQMDTTHYNEKGANMMADYVSSELEKLPLAINQYLK